MKLGSTFKIYLRSFFLCSYLSILVACSIRKVKHTPSPAEYTRIDQIDFNDGYAKQKQPFIVFSDRSGNRLNPSAADDPFGIVKDAPFLNAYIVLKETSGFYKVAEYKPDLINDGKLPKSKSIKVAGWIPEDHLLLWNNCIKASNSGFALKSAIVINHEDVINNTQKYISNDSIILFSNPDLLTKTSKKISLGSIVYTYKISEDRNSVLIGKKQTTNPDSIKSTIYGWVSKKVLSKWGERFGVKLSSDTTQLSIKTSNNPVDYALAAKDLNKRVGLESIYPNAGADSIKFFTNVLDYTGNKIYNVLGNPIYYKRYREILSNNRKLNVVFVLDVSKNNRLYIPVVKSLLQELQLKFANPDYFSSVKFGGVVYKQNTCGINQLHSPLSNNYRDVALFLEDKIDRLTCSDNDLVQPVDKGLAAASKMLAGKEDETNMVILIGTTADEGAQSQSAINALTRINAKLIYFQTQSKTADPYNDYVLLGEKLVVNSAQNIAERKKEKIVNQQDLLINNTYSLNTGENGIYYLNYPSQSMTQGFVIFPKKGETMQAGILKSAIDTLLLQVTLDNKKIDSTLTKYFRSDIGVNNTKISNVYRNLFPSIEAYIPASIASALLNEQTSFLLKGAFVQKKDSIGASFKRGILLDDMEYEQLRILYGKIYKKVSQEGITDKQALMRLYINAISENIPVLKIIEKGELKRMPMSEIMKLLTGFELPENSLMELSASCWVRRKEISVNSVIGFIQQFKDISEKMSVAKGQEAITIKHKGQVFYWLNEEFIPVILL